MVKWLDEKTNVKDSLGNNISYKKCSEWDDNDVNACKDQAPEGTKGWIPCAIGSNPETGGCSPYSEDFNCLWGQDCFAVQEFSPPKPKWVDKVENIKDTKGSIVSYEKCTEWVDDDVNSCKKNEPKDTKGWIKCATGSNPQTGGCSPYTEDFSCVWGQDCFAVTKMSPVWDQEVTGCDGAGSELTIQKCNNWPNDDPRFCNINKPKNTIAWASCAIGSSPGGVAPGDDATVCGKTSHVFNCVGGMNCFAITDTSPNVECEKSFFIDPLGAIEDQIDLLGEGFEDAKIYIILVIIIMILSCISSVFLRLSI